MKPFQPSRLNRFAYTTEHVQRFMEYAGNPQDTPKAIHVAGTSGKTSTAYYAAALLQQAGKRVGLLVSPHVEYINERVQINLEPLAEKVFCAELAIFLEVVRKSGVTLTYAELLYAFAYWEFARQNVDYIVVEVGMGGLLDATNVIERTDKICVITDIGLDHTNVLGSTLAEITGHKAGIIRLHNAVFCHQQAAEILNVIRAECRLRRADLHIISRAEKGPGMAFLPLFQQRNFALSLKAVSFALEREGTSLSAEAIEAAARTAIPSRMEQFTLDDRTLVIDGAHNAQKLEALRASIEALFPGKSRSLLVGFTGGRGRDIGELAAILANLKPLRIIVTSLQEHGGLPARIDPRAVGEACTAAGVSDVQVITDQKQACEALLEGDGEVLLVTGSLYLAGELKPLLRRITAPLT